MAWRRPTTLALLEDHGASLADLLARNRGGDRGEEPPKGARRDELLVLLGSRILSSYRVGKG
jgi:hypothetical protein